MKMSIRTSSGILFVFGAVVFALIALAVSPVKAIGVGPSPGFSALQLADGAGWGILGIAVGAGLAIGLAGIGAGLGMGTASAAALGAITEKPETFGKSILYVVFIEAIGIYGFVIAFLLTGYLPSIIG
ncbi:MAG: ATP synthase subunit C [Candidatus Thorarchaeota archaeon]|jgi:V/A-type H+-transporting ATPase subunit K